MKKFIITAVIVALFASGSALMAQDRQENYLGLPGDNLDLYAVMNLFQQSKTLEDFEKSLNDNNTNINNLDLNGDGQVDYIKVIDNVDGDVHNIVLQVAISPRENQDVAVFTVQRFNNGTVQIQLTGDEDLYGKNYIIEPIYERQTPNPGYTGNDTYVTTTPAQVAVWPVVRFIYLPSYRVWHSNWYWGYYPSYWHPWRPVSWHYYYGYQSNWDHIYYSRYHIGQSHISSGWHDYYYVGRRAYSPEVNHRITTGVYKTTYSHPDQKREGEEKFASAHPEQYKSIHSNSSVHAIDNNNSGRSNGNNNSSDRRNNGSNLNNKNNNSAHPNGNNSSVSRRTDNNKNGNSAHPNGNNSSSTTKTVVNPTVSRTNETSRRSSSTMSNPSGVNHSNGKVNTSSSRSTVTNKSSNNPSTPQNVRSSSQSKTTTVSSSNRSTKQADKKTGPTREKKNDTDSKGPDRR
jgi:hypothetical protein